MLRSSSSRSSACSRLSIPSGKTSRRQAPHVSKRDPVLRLDFFGEIGKRNFHLLTPPRAFLMPVFLWGPFWRHGALSRVKGTKLNCRSGKSSLGRAWRSRGPSRANFSPTLRISDEKLTAACASDFGRLRRRQRQPRSIDDNLSAPAARVSRARVASSGFWREAVAITRRGLHWVIH